MLGANLNLGWQQGTEEKVTTDAAGNMTESEVTGTQGMGGSFGVGAARIGDSSTSTAKSKRDGKGNVQLDLTKEKTSTSLKKLVKKLPFMGDDEPEGTDKKKPTGLLSDAAGGGAADDGIDDKDLAELRVSRVDLVKIAAIAKDDVNRLEQPAAATSLKSYEPWRELGRKIAGGASDPGAVADALARFVGGDKSKRMADPRPAAPAERRHLDGGADEFSRGRAEAAEAVYRPGHCCLRSADRSQGEGADGHPVPKGGAEAHRPDRQALHCPHRAPKPTRSSVLQVEMLSATQMSARHSLALAARGRNAGKQSDALTELEAPEERVRAPAQGLRPLRTPATEVLELIDGAPLEGDPRPRVRRCRGADRQLSDLYAIWKRDIEKALGASASKIGRPESDLDRYRPDLARFEKLKKACRH